MDAATFFLSYQFPADNPDTHTRYAWFARPVWLLCGGNIIAFRFATLALLAVAALIFWRSWRPLLAGPTNGISASIALGLSTIAGLAWLPILLGYNSLSTFFALLAMAALAPVLGVGPGNIARPSLRIAMVTIFIGLVGAVALVKPPAALALIAWSGFLALNLVPVLRPWRATAVVVVAAAGTGALVWVGRWMRENADDPTALIQFGGLKLNPHWVLQTCERYGQELWAFLPILGCDLALTSIPALALAAPMVCRLRRPDYAIRITIGTVWFFVTSLLCVAIGRGLWDGSFSTAVTGEISRFYLVFWAALLPAWLLAWFRSPSEETRPALAAITFFFLPLSCGFGSTNTIYFSALHWTVFWTAGLLIISRSIARALIESRFQTFVAGGLILTAIMHIWSGHFLRPYMHQPPLWRQNVPAAVGHPATTLKLDAATADFLGEVRDTLDAHGYRPGDDVFGFFNLPGVVFAVGGRSPGAPWYFGTWYHGDDTDGGKIRAVPIERRQNAWILTQADVTNFRREFQNCGIDFPDGYKIIGQTINPATGLEIGIWKPNSR